MAERQPKDTAARFLPPREERDLDHLRNAARGCTACPLHETGTQTVFGEGPPHAPLMLVGEQPGDKEDLAGRPFVGPAGQLLDRALADAGIDRRKAYVTNTVKHFKWVQKGKRRLHEKPGRMEIIACLPWLEAEIAAVAPTGIVCLGATAAQALIGRGFKVTQDRGEFLRTPLAGWITGTIHPSALLRITDREMAEQAYTRFVADLARVADRLGDQSGPEDVEQRAAG
ncbi:UdgX family uracil-DNA binding protein [Indioceanicola profundi]|uniref:UdgX family uracil-DNA binding protein n=1 Tax=Indioceanicola profundi TaxID=2220096 RepID=UPI000E6AE0B9